MTTYRLTGFSLDWSDTDGDGGQVILGTSKLKIVTQDSDTSFSYAITVAPEDPNELPQIQMLNSNPYNVFVDGERTTLNTPISIGEVHWDPDNVAQLMSFFSSNGVDHIFNINGDNLSFATPADFEAFDTSGAYFGEVLELGWQAGDSIDFADFSNVTISEHDKIYGSNAKDTISGGIGKDKIWGGNKADILSGGKGSDKLYG